ncbi:TerD family protein [Actinomadura miaoliensis]|uniref:TerD family protein n=1 Tax=Actinomadura miaoliensis TaxID=430685 RepID=UPI0031E70BF4
MNSSLTKLVVQHTCRVPFPEGPAGSGAVAARQFDAVLMTVGFKLSSELLAHLSGLSEGTVIDTAVRVLPVVRAMVGGHVQHNAYFRDFPRDVPDTLDFWLRCLRQALADPEASPGTAATVADEARHGVLNLLALPAYGRYQHTYEEMLAAHDELIAKAADRVTILHLGRGLAEELQDLYLRLAGSVTPLGDDDLRALRRLAGHCATGPQPETIPIRENRAVVNQARLAAGADPLLDTVTDVLRLACALSGGDVTLQEPTRFASLSRSVRRSLLAGLDDVVRADPGKLGDVAARREQWKRLGERLHPHEYPRWPHAAQVFAVARRERTAPSFAARVEARLAAGDVPGAATLLKGAPGLLFRSLDRLLRTASTPAERDAVLEIAETVAGRVSGRVVLSVREHLLNRAAGGGTRVFANRLGRGITAPDTRPPLDEQTVERLAAFLDAEIQRRLPPIGRLLVDPDVLDVALPLSGKATADGLGVLPRGSVTRVDGELLRFFVHWRQRDHDTDFDLSALMLDGDYRNPTWLSYTSLTQVGGEHSGDIVVAPDGATEFINLRLDRVPARFVIPQVNIYSGEGFDRVAESFFGFMLRDADQAGRPFEPRTVRMKSELRGPGRVALPLVFMRGDDGRWRAKWLHLHLKGRPAFNRVEGNRLSTARLVRATVERRYLTVRHLIGLLAERAGSVTTWDGRTIPGGPVTFIGLERPEGLHEASRVFTPDRLRDLIPA